MTNSDPLQNRHPTTSYGNIFHWSLSRYACQIRCKSVHMHLLSKWENIAKTILCLYKLFLETSLEHTLDGLLHVMAQTTCNRLCTLLDLIQTYCHHYYYNCLTALWILHGTNWVSQYQKKHSSTHTHRDHQSFLICFLPMASFLFKLRIWQSFCTISVQVFFDLPFDLAPSTS